MKEQTQPRITWLVDGIFLTIAISCLYLLWLGSYPLFTPDEGRYCEIAREMVAHHQYITPKIIGIPFLDKPILYYWLQTLAINFFGSSEFACRFFPACLGIFGCLLTYAAGRLVDTRRTGIYASLILATSPLYFVGSHYANLDLEVAVWLAASLLSLWVGFFQIEKKSHSTVFFLAAYVFAALAFLTKGLMAIAFPACISLIYLLLTKRLAWLKSMKIITGASLFIAISLPWYVLAQHDNPNFLHYFFITQQVTRFLSHASFNNALPVWFYLPVFMVGFFPWILFLIPACLMIKNKMQNLFLIIWIAFIFSFFSIPHSKIITYILPIFPAAALLVAQYFTNTKKIGLKLLASLIIINASLLLFITEHAHLYNKTSAKKITLQLKSKLNPHDQVVSFYQFPQDVPLYLEREIAVVADWKSKDIADKDNWRRELWLGSQLTQDKSNLWTASDLQTAWKLKQQIYIFVSENYLIEFLQTVPHPVLISQRRGLYLFSNHRLEHPILTDHVSQHWENHGRY